MIILGFEGLDKSGKRTQSELLHQSLYERGFEVVKSEFHNYSSPTGQLIRKFLDGEYQPNQLAIEAIMAADKYAQLDWFNELAEKTDVLILDRYLTSQCVYSHANGIDIDFTTNMLQYMPPADFQFYLDIEAEESMKRKGEHGENDLYESNLDLLNKARQLYLKYMHLEVLDNKGMILDATKTPQDLHSLILDRTLSLLGKEVQEA
ncbi:dTMP kinase [Cytobacillus oceanisediminis]|uniref:dTMP kinase n=1 Tax=Cytobacillus oceanisediminis TaxID=665099 RepID=UPI001FB283F8|nr:dTMP kinase [Cytobacillus oceanisediminis]UOE58185.1 dTMP kinase [Cytobacillus oceanisediminis]